MTPNKISLLLTNKIITQSPEYKENKNKIRYGLEWILFNLYQVAIIYLVMIPFGLFIEATICLLTIVFIRTFTGGPHFSNPWYCMIASTLTIFLLIYLGQLLTTLPNMKIIIYSTYPLFVFIIWMYAPRIYKTAAYLKNKKKRQKILSLVMLTTVYIFIVLIKDNPLLWTVPWITMVYLMTTITPVGEKTIIWLDKKINDYSVKEVK